jgi:hypothetical protein
LVSLKDVVAEKWVSCAAPEAIEALPLTRLELDGFRAFLKQEQEPKSLFSFDRLYPNTSRFAEFHFRAVLVRFIAARASRA